jgi:hypothetical protein
MVDGATQLYLRHHQIQFRKLTTAMPPDEIYLNFITQGGNISKIRYGNFWSSASSDHF